ncbi:winged helix-turn-helix domain-containing protein [Paenibacillus glufosinatiresistens]|uniref:winged helix-turn-helix domain-containing protein n=1 Tax=Paenibacillus glufosinatiresistens TaxID=3070657 RepID=UPI00286DCF7D|nr:winged helix-turn-helix domain-containing protein [Paenibacillus sp. YX.27]
MLELNENGYTASAAGVTVTLLPKEFALLRFLVQGRDRAFTREHLLDAVWPLEYPVERTVDDHIYRLRRKLAPLPGVTIRTVRGLGYSLTLKEPGLRVDANPSARDDGLREAMRGVFATYQRYGQGRSMLALARQQEVLGYEIDPFYAWYIHFVEGDLEWLLGDTLPLTERIYALLLFAMTGLQAEESLRYAECALEREVLSPFQHAEMKVLNILDLYAVTGRFERAEEQLTDTYEVIASPDFENFDIPVATSALFVRLLAGAPDETLREDECRIEAMMRERPFLREIGSFTVLRGLIELRSGEEKRAGELLEEGLDVLEVSGFVPLKLSGLHRIVHACRRMGLQPEHPLRNRYEARFADELERYGIPGALPRLRKQLDAALGTH